MASKKAEQDPGLRQQEEIFGILLMTLASLVLISLLSYDPSEEPMGLEFTPVKNAMGVVGVYISHYLIKFFIGYSSIIIPFLLLAWGWNRFRGNDPGGLARGSFYSLGIAIYISMLLGLPEASNPEGAQFGFDFSGLVGGFLATMVYSLFGRVGSIIVSISIALIFFVAATQISFAQMVAIVLKVVDDAVGAIKKQIANFKLPPMPKFERPVRQSDDVEKKPERMVRPQLQPQSPRNEPRREPLISQPQEKERRQPPRAVPNYKKIHELSRQESTEIPAQPQQPRNLERPQKSPSTPPVFERQSLEEPEVSPQKQRPEPQLRSPEPTGRKPGNLADSQPADPPFDAQPQRETPSTPQPAPFDAPPPLDHFDQVTVTEREDVEEVKTDAELPNPVALGDYVFPGLEFLHYPESLVSVTPQEELKENGRTLERRLEEFGVSGQIVAINPGPVITRYEYEPAPGVKISRITNLSDDLAMAMRAQRIRIVAPIPGKAAVGIELPNREPDTVYLRQLLDCDDFEQSDSPLAIALGKTISGKPFVTNLDKMPHLLVAGSTGSGKSVCLNAIISSILYKAHPTEVKFVLIDPKRLELNLYSQLINHHLIYREDLNEVVVTNPQNALAVLRSVEYEMEQRYDLFAGANVRNIADYNSRARAGRIKTDDGELAEPLPYIVVVIDELADLMLMAAKEVEEPIARLTQMARAIGIHMIVATQRPSVDVITGVIKANFPARIAFAVASKTDSRTILDANGAEKLLGRGDMLYMPPGSPEIVRLHGAFITTDEIEQILEHIHRQPRYPTKLLPIRDEEIDASFDVGDGRSERDALFNEAVKLIVRHQQGSISLLQRRLKVGYARAARLIDELEAAGIVGGFDGSKAREVLVGEDFLEVTDLDEI